MSTKMELLPLKVVLQKKRKDAFKVKFTDGEAQKLINSRRKEPVLLQCTRNHKDYFVKDAKFSAIHRILKTHDNPGKQQEILFLFKIFLTITLCHKYENCTIFSSVVYDFVRV